MNNNRPQNNQQPYLLLLGICVAIVGYIVFEYKPFHVVPEGHIGVYWRFGALLPYSQPPGLSFHNPFTTRVGFVQVTMQTDTITNIPCGTNSGVMIYFDKIEVVNSITVNQALRTVKMYGENYDRIWIFDKIHHEINQFCSKHTLQEVYIEKFETLDEALSKALQKDCDKYETGIMVNAIRVTKPRIPEQVRVLYERVESYKAQYMVAEEQQLVVQRQEETLRMQEVMRAEKEAEVAKIAAQKEAQVSLIREAQKTAEAQAQASRAASVSIIEQRTLTTQKEGLVNRSRIDNAMMTNRLKSQSEAKRYSLEREAEALKLKLTPEYIQYQIIASLGRILARNTTFYLGPKIPNTFINLGDNIAPLFDRVLRKP